MRTHRSFLTLLGGAAFLVGCSDLPDVPTVPAIPHSAEAALQTANQTILSFDQALGDYTIATGLFTDELTIKNDPNNVALDRRQLAGADVEKVSNTYQSLQSTRLAADIAAKGFIAYAPTISDSLRARMYAIEGYTEVMLAEFFCSGIPLSTVDLSSGALSYSEGTSEDSLYNHAISRDSVYSHAISLFDSAVVLAVGNDSVLTLARVGKGRALLNMGRFAEAAQAVASVPEGSQYIVDAGFTGRPVGIGYTQDNPMPFNNDQPADREGQVGLPFASSHDPRTLQQLVVETNAPNKYLYHVDSLVKTKGNTLTSYTQFVVADWIEARLIQAEAALQAGETTTWLNTLNALRATAPVAPAQGQTVVPLSPLTDPGAAAARVNTMFTERGAWLYITGHRQGDLRRLIRQYGRDQNQVYPSGSYAGSGMYGSDVVAPVPSVERRSNRYAGCLDLAP